MRIYSWNVNGIRAIERKGFIAWMIKTGGDIVCLQEIKAMKEQLSQNLLNIDSYKVFINSAERKGYSGVAIYTKREPNNVEYGLGAEEYDHEGRVLTLTFNNIKLYNIYFPNGQKNEERLQYKMNFYDIFLEKADRDRKAGYSIIVCGDFNTAHKEIDLFHPKENANRSGFLPIEREWIDKFISHGYIDTFRYFNKEPYNYTWWDYKSHARERNIGWRIDYFFISEELLPKLKNAQIHSDIMGSDHCPISIDIEI